MLKGPLVFVAHCERENYIRLISAWQATPSEKRQYEEAVKDRTTDELEYDLSRLKGGVRGKYSSKRSYYPNVVDRDTTCAKSADSTRGIALDQSRTAGIEPADEIAIRMKYIVPRDGAW